MWEELYLLNMSNDKCKPSSLYVQYGRNKKALPTLPNECRNIPLWQFCFQILQIIIGSPKTLLENTTPSNIQKQYVPVPSVA